MRYGDRVNALAHPPHPEPARGALTRFRAFLRALFPRARSQVNARAPQGDTGRRRQHTDRGKRPTPQSSNPATYTPEGWSDECDKVRRDPKMWAGCIVRLETFMSAGLRAIPNGTTPEAKAAADLVNRAFGWDGHAGHFERGWQQVFAELCGVADLKGASLGEERWEVVAGELVPVDIEQRHVANLRAWAFDERGNVTGAHMRTAELFREYTLPLGRAADAAGGGVHFTFSIDGDPEGRLSAVLGPVIDWVALKEHMTKTAWDGVSRWAMPVVNAVLSAEVAQRMGMELDDPTITQLVTRASEAAADFMAGEEGALSSSDVIRFEPFGGLLDLKAWVDLCNQVDHEGLTAIGTPNLTMGVSAQHGSRSAAETIDDLLLRQVAGRLSRFLAQLRRQTVARLVRFNLGDVPLPLLVHEGLGEDGLGYHMGNVPHLVAAGFLNPADPADRRKIRKTLGLDPSTPAAVAPPLTGLPALGNPGSAGPGRGNDFALDGTTDVG